jgi:signal peptidase I
VSLPVVHTNASPDAAPKPAQAAAPLRTRSTIIRELLSLFVKIAAILAAGILALTFVFGLEQNVGTDMAPAVKDGDLVAFYRLDKSYVAGDLLWLSYQGEHQLRRVVATAGDRVDISEDGLMINGALQQEPEIYEKTYRYAEGIAFPLTVEPGQVFVLADSREGATDSRIYGAVKIDDTLGSAIAVFRRRGL